MPCIYSVYIVCAKSFFNNYYYTHTHKKVERAWILCSRPFSFRLHSVSRGAVCTDARNISLSAAHHYTQLRLSDKWEYQVAFFFFFFSPIAAGYYCPFFIFEMDSLNMMEYVYWNGSVLTYFYPVVFVLDDKITGKFTYRKQRVVNLPVMREEKWRVATMSLASHRDAFRAPVWVYDEQRRTLPHRTRRYSENLNQLYAIIYLIIERLLCNPIDHFYIRICIIEHHCSWIRFTVALETQLRPRSRLTL